MNTSTNYAAEFYAETDHDLEVLEKNVQDFPASSVARFLLLYHHKKNNNPAFDELAKETAVYLSNPKWSEYQLWQVDNSTENNPEEIIEENKESHLSQSKEEEEISASVKEDVPNDQPEIIEIPSSEPPSYQVEHKDDFRAEIKEEEELPASVNEEIMEIPSSEIESDDDAESIAAFTEEKEFTTSNEEIIENSSYETNPAHKENIETDLEKINAGEKLPASVNEELDEIPSSEIESNDDAESIAAFTEEKEFTTSNEEIIEISSSVYKENTESDLEKTNAGEELPASVNEEITEIPSSAIDGENKENFLAEIKEEQEDLPASVKEELIEIPASGFTSPGEENKEGQSEKTSEEEELLPSVKEEIIEIPGSELVPVDEQNKETDLKTVKPATKSEEENNGSEEENGPEDKSVLNVKIPGEEINSSVPTSNPPEEEHEEVAFEPLHTVDYFASQGIKINEEELANDHLVKQVKSFTAWLKSMKKLHPGQIPEQNEVIEKIIQASSESSNKDANVLTEAMAEVLIKQGKREKAMEMYEKLSLINPSKSAYFAAKIENLKIV